MAKRKTIGENPLDAIVPDPVSSRQEDKPEAQKPQSPIPVSPASARRPVQPAPASRKPEKGLATPAQVTRSQTPSQEDLLSRIQSVEEQSEWIKWLAFGAIGLALLL